MTALPTTRTGFTFRVYAGEFCRVLEAIALFQSTPKLFSDYAAVRCIARYDGLTMLATNSISAAVGTVSTEAQDGVGLFSIGHAQTKAILAVFKRPLPKGTEPDEYVLEIRVTDDTVRILDISDLFDADELTVQVPALADLERGEESDSQRVMRTAAVLSRVLDADGPFDMARGVYFSQDQMAKIARAAKILGVEVSMRPARHGLLAPLGSDVVAYTSAFERARDAEGGTSPFIDERTLREQQTRLSEIVDEGVLE